MSANIITGSEPNGITISENGEMTIDLTIDKKHWLAAYWQCRQAKSFSSAWIKKLKSHAVENYGKEFYNEAESLVSAQFMLIPEPEDDGPQVNSGDKSDRLLSIEGLHSRFMIWGRKMKDIIPSWEVPQLEKALALLEPMENQAKQIREILSSKR